MQAVSAAVVEKMKRLEKQGVGRKAISTRFGLHHSTVSKYLGPKKRKHG